MRVFIKDEDFEVIPINYSLFKNLHLGGNSFIINKSGFSNMGDVQRELYTLLEGITGTSYEWGIITGVRPLKIALDIYDKVGSIESTEKILKEQYFLSDKKILLLSEIIKYQKENINDPLRNSAGVYVGIPFCPTRCEYCSFASRVADEDSLNKYLDNLLKEISYTGKLIRENGTFIESIYVGGGTPTVLSPEQEKRLIDSINDDINVQKGCTEFTVEAGRPDTITAEKLEIMRSCGVSRISINPQTMKDETLRQIGRKHTSEDIKRGYDLASKYGFDVINADIITGLPNETFEDFSRTLSEVISMGADNITVHTLSVKKGSILKEYDPELFRRNIETVDSMLDYAYEVLTSKGFYPYYIYRQKHQIGFLENVGYCKLGKHSLYNIRIMEEKQTIIALGAGAVGKVYYHDEGSLERIPNVSNPDIYNERIDEMLDRKNKYYGG